MQILLQAWRFCRAKLSALDPVLVTCSTLLSLISWLTLIGGREAFGTRSMIMQIGATLVGFVGMVVLANLDYRFLAQKLWPLFFGGSVVLMLLLLMDGVGAGTNQS